MIGAQQLSLLASTFPVVQSAPREIQEHLGLELDPSEQVRAIEAMRVGEEPGLLVGTSTRLLAVYFTKLLWKRMPTIQTFHYPHVNRVEVRGSDAYVHASVSPGGGRDDEYEENTFRFASPQTAQQLHGFLHASSPRMQGR